MLHISLNLEADQMRRDRCFVNRFVVEWQTIYLNEPWSKPEFMSLDIMHRKLLVTLVQLLGNLYQENRLAGTIWIEKFEWQNYRLHIVSYALIL